MATAMIAATAQQPRSSDPRAPIRAIATLVHIHIGAGLAQRDGVEIVIHCGAAAQMQQIARRCFGSKHAIQGTSDD